MRALKKNTLSLLCSLTLFGILFPSPSWTVKSASIVICAETGKIHHASNADVITHPASLTKMMTLYLAFQALRKGRITFDQKLSVSKHATQQEPGNLWLKKGGFLTVREAILGMVTKSANDAAVVLAETLGGGSEVQFAKAMTQQARKLGMTKTVFKNASGLPNKQQITTAREMAILSRALYRHFPEYFRFFKEKQFAYKGTIHKNHNHLLGKVKGVDGIKTGFTCASGFNLAASMVRDNHRIIAVVLGGESIKARDKKMTLLLETTYAKFKGNSSPQTEGRHASIGDLIHTLSPFEARMRSSNQAEQAVYLSGRGKVERLKAKYHSLNDLFAAIGEQPKAANKPPKKRRKKARKSS
jgi:D-alanyl-D-alanine carboxypeptidase